MSVWDQTDKMDLLDFGIDEFNATCNVDSAKNWALWYKLFEARFRFILLISYQTGICPFASMCALHATHKK